MRLIQHEEEEVKPFLDPQDSFSQLSFDQPLTIFELANLANVIYY